MVKKSSQDTRWFQFSNYCFPHPRILPELLGLRIGLNQVSSCQFPQFLFVLLAYPTTLNSFCCSLLLKSSSLPLPPALSGTCMGHLQDHLPSLSSSLISDALFPTTVHMAALGWGESLSQSGPMIVSLSLATVDPDTQSETKELYTGGWVTL